MATATSKKTKGEDSGLDHDLLAKYKNFPGIKVLSRRLENPDLPGSLPIRLKDEPDYLRDPQGKKRIWYLRWINAAENGRWATVTDAMGYVPVQRDELQNAEAITGLSESKDGIVRRGDKGQEVLVKMPLELYTAIKARQQEQRKRRARNVKAVREDIAQAAGMSLGSQAGDFIHDDLSVEVKRTGRSTIEKELEGA
jgi:hypothetical protein